MKVLPEQLRVYAVTDRSGLGERGLPEAVAQAIAGGATIVQLREKELTGAALETLARQVGEVCRAGGVPYIINDSPALALAVGADGVHLGLEDGEIAAARALLGPDKIIGASAHNAEEARAAQQAGADYLGCGAVFGSKTKTNVRPITPDILREVTAAVEIPVVAIGGITAENLPELRGCGIAGAAVVSALFAKKDITAAAAELAALAETL